MCGIIAYTGPRTALPVLLAGLHRLEYRGYDSAGIAVHSGQAIKTHKRTGRIHDLEKSLPKRVTGKTGIGHTRWATHGEPTDLNAHPHQSEDASIAVVHNGIIENASELRARLVAHGCTMRSETDTEVLAHLIEQAKGGSLEERVAIALRAITGTYGIAVLDRAVPNTIVVARNGSPVILGLGDKEMFAASDVSALVRYTQQVVHLDDGELAVLEPAGFRTLTLDQQPREKTPDIVTYEEQAYELGQHAHYLRKEIEEQPEAVSRTLRGRLDRRFNTARLDGLNLAPRDFLDIRRVKILGCGSAYYAGMAGAHMLETMARVPADAEPAAEFRYRNPVIEKDVLYIAVSQSGETLDTLAAVQEVKRKGGHTLGIVNVVGSTIARAVDGGIYVHAGPEVSVASTKTFTCTLVAFALLALHFARVRDFSPQQGAKLISALDALPDALAQALRVEAHVAELAKTYSTFNHAFYIGRASGYPVALEGAQKLKEVSYIHAEAYPASELKHGPLALACPDIPTLVVLPHDDLLDKSLNSLSEVRARRSPVIALTHAGDTRINTLADDVIETPMSIPALHPMVMGVPLQLFAYHCALELGRDVDKPRNLAKSVTVE